MLLWNRNFIRLQWVDYFYFPARIKWVILYVCMREYDGLYIYMQKDY